MSEEKQQPTRLPKVNGRLLGTAAVIVLGALLVWGFFAERNQTGVDAERNHAVKAPLRVAGKNGETVITIDDEIQRRSGIETNTLPAAPHQAQIRAYGMVLEVARLTELSNSYANAKAQMRTAQAKLALSRVRFERATKLYNDNKAVSEAEMQSAEAALATEQASLEAAQAQVRSLTATAYQDWGSVIGKSLVDESPMVAHLIERQDFLLQITTPPGAVLEAAPATATIENGTSGRTTITFVSPATHTDPKIQGVSFFYSAPADSGVLPGMNVLAFLPTGKIVDGVAVPAAAVVWWQDRAWVYQRTGADKFVRVEIATDLPAPDGGYIVAGMAKDAEIVTSGAQLLLSEEFRSQIQVDEGD